MKTLTQDKGQDWVHIASTIELFDIVSIWYLIVTDFPSFSKGIYGVLEFNIFFHLQKPQLQQKMLKPQRTRL